MEYKISKELFEAVIGVELYLDKSFDFKLMHDLSEYDLSYNDFFFACKKWALEQGYSCLSGKDRHLVKDERYVCSIGSSKVLIEDFFADTEQQAVFDACEWILENK